MRKRLVMAAPLAAIVLAAWLTGLAPAAGAKAPQTATLAATALTPIGYSTHNYPGHSDCASFVSQSGASDTTNGEVHGQLDNAKGSFEGFVRLPDGVTVTAFSLLVNDADGDSDVFAYLVRRNIADGLNKDQGYLIMAKTQSDGAVLDTIRQFQDTSITGKVIDNSHSAYFVEMVDCGIPEPFAVSVTYTTP
jgi:hypothetical protein